ncbi:hypothetical protein QUF49_16605 [Fictibacillus sp. b24]|nr:hypothetical protein [Fictibacillus sp. b24]MDM5317632.1 hypothetical protein [Fictibacillus sp. b24]
MRDSWGISGTGETHKRTSAEVAHRTPPGKRAPETEINYPKS